MHVKLLWTQRKILWSFYAFCICLPLILADAWHWQSIDDAVIMPAVPNGGHKDFIKNYDLCLTGEVSTDNITVGYIVLYSYFFFKFLVVIHFFISWIRETNNLKSMWTFFSICRIKIFFKYFVVKIEACFFFMFVGYNIPRIDRQKVSS